jgi:hypothetical protein
MNDNMKHISTSRPTINYSLNECICHASTLTSSESRILSAVARLAEHLLHPVSRLRMPIAVLHSSSEHRAELNKRTNEWLRKRN